MVEHFTANSRYYNGKSAIPENGIAEVYPQHIKFRTEETELLLAYSHIYKCEITHLGCRFVIQEDAIAESPVLEIFCEPNQSKEIETYWIQKKKEQGRLSRWKYSLHKISPITAAIIGTVFFLIVGVLYFKGLQLIVNFIPETWDKKLGDTFESNLEENLSKCDSKGLERFFDKAVRSMVLPNSTRSYKVILLKDPVINAFALSNGTIVFFTGLIEEAGSQDEVIGVLAHEIAHVEKRHHMRNLIKAGGTSVAISILIGPGLGGWDIFESLTELSSTILVLKFSRDFEREADAYALDVLKRSNYSLEGYLKFLERIQKMEEIPSDEGNEPDRSQKFISFLNFLSTHPATEERVEYLKSNIDANTKKSTRKVVSDQEWKRIQMSCQPK